MILKSNCFGPSLSLSLAHSHSLFGLFGSRVTPRGCWRLSQRRRRYNVVSTSVSSSENGFCCFIRVRSFRSSKRLHAQWAGACECVCGSEWVSGCVCVRVRVRGSETFAAAFFLFCLRDFLGQREAVTIKPKNSSLYQSSCNMSCSWVSERREGIKREGEGGRKKMIQKREFL